MLAAPPNALEAPPAGGPNNEPVPVEVPPLPPKILPPAGFADEGQNQDEVQRK